MDRSYADERRAGGSVLGASPWRGFLRRHAGGGLLGVTFASGAALAVATVLTAVAITEAAAIAVAKPKAPLVALAVAFDLAHHCRGTFLVLAHPNREVTHHVLAQTLLPLDLVERRRRRIDI